jgi:hypothetical protein
MVEQATATQRVFRDMHKYGYHDRLYDETSQSIAVPVCTARTLLWSSSGVAGPGALTLGLGLGLGVDCSRITCRGKGRRAMSSIPHPSSPPKPSNPSQPMHTITQAATPTSQMQSHGKVGQHVRADPCTDIARATTFEVCAVVGPLWACTSLSPCLTAGSLPPPAAMRTGAPSAHARAGTPPPATYKGRYTG